ncbi:allophanate hydrolase, partial [Vibrio fortis]
TSFTVSQNSNRMGYRLSGEPVESPAITMLSEGIALGAIQIPKDGQPIILLNDRQTIGGYPKLGCVARIDLPRLAQAKPGQHVTFVEGDRSGLQDVWCQWARFFGY